MKEAQIQTIFGKNNKVHGVFELKICNGSSLRVDAVKPHQMEALLAARGDGLYHKITDQPIFFGQKTRFHSLKPFDCFYLKDTPAYIVVCIYTPRKPKEFCYILPEKWKHDTKKSLNREEIRAVSEFIEIYR